jgi:DNA-binding MarR family transcriptional regulator
MSIDIEQRLEEMAPGIALDDFLPYLMNRIVNRMNQSLADDLKAIGHNVQAYRVLAILTARDGRSINELAVYSVTEQPTLSRIVERMARRGLVERRQGTADARRVQVFLTDDGRKAYNDILPLALKHYDRAMAGMGAADRKDLARLLHRLLDNVRASEFP